MCMGVFSQYNTYVLSVCGGEKWVLDPLDVMPDSF